MPRVLVLCDDRDADDRGRVQRAADGAKSIRFTEVDIRTLAQNATAAAPHRVLESADVLGEYSGVVVVTGSEISGAMSALLDDWDRTPAAGYPDVVVGVVGGGAALLNRIVRLGAILIGESRDGDPETRAWQTGARVAKVSEWVRHALSHEHGPAERQHSHHSAGHPHAH